MNLTAARLVLLSYATLIAYLSLSSGELQDWGDIAYLDKMQHAMAYSGFGFLGLLLCSKLASALDGGSEYSVIQRCD